MVLKLAPAASALDSTALHHPLSLPVDDAAWDADSSALLVLLSVDRGVLVSCVVASVR